MRTLSKRLLFAGLLLSLVVVNAAAQNGGDIERQRLGQTGMKFLNQSVDARSAALGDAVTALGGSSAALFYNPAGIAFVEGALSAGIGRVAWIGDITYHVGSVAFRPGGGRFGVFGLTVESVDYGEVPSTIRADNDKGYLDVGTVSPSGLAAGVGYGRLLTDRFAVGGHVKYVRQSLGASVVTYGAGGGAWQDHVKSTVAVDFGVLYRTGFRSLNFAVNVRNFSRDLKYAKDSFELPLTMRIGFSMDMMDLTAQAAGPHSMLLAVDAERPRDFAEQVKAGLEYGYKDILALRAGYAFPTDEQGVNLGFGLHYPIQEARIGFDYAYTRFGTFGDVNRISLSVGF